MNKFFIASLLLSLPIGYWLQNFLTSGLYYKIAPSYEMVAILIGGLFIILYAIIVLLIRQGYRKSSTSSLRGSD